MKKKRTRDPIKSPGRPALVVRMDAKDLVTLREMTRAYGSATVSEFVREMLTSILNGKANEFLGKLIERTTRQMVLSLLPGEPENKRPLTRKGGANARRTSRP